MKYVIIIIITFIIIIFFFKFFFFFFFRENVVAIFTCGAAWQFKGWKWSNPTELFSKSMLIKYEL